MRKKRILFCSEATFLNTGYATYTREILNYLYSTGKYEIAEMACYGERNDPRAEGIPWLYYGNAPNVNCEPKAPQEEIDRYHSIPTNQFGQHSFESVCLDFLPDVVCDIRDFWMLDFAERSPYRPHFKWAVMPTVDAAPQARQWLATYANADACFSYSDWAGEVLQDEGGGSINYLGSAPPSAHPAYEPVENKLEHKEKMGINPEWKIIGTVMRNQRRKLFPDLFKAFRNFLDISGRNDVYLYCHTSYPDLGWDIPELLLQNEIASRVLFTYVCRDTNKSFVSVFKGPVCQSPYSNKWNAVLSNVKTGLSYEDLASVINTFDLYVQYANCEGFGLPQVEAAACGVPVMATDWSAMTSVVRKLEGWPIKPKALYKELETGCDRAVPDNDLAAKMFKDFFDLSEEEQEKAGDRCRENFLKHYQWDLSGAKWEAYFDSIDLPGENEGWSSKPQFFTPSQKPEQLPPDVRHSDLARWLIENVLGDPSKIGSYFESRLSRDMMYQTSTASTGGMYFNEASAAFDGQNHRQPFNFDIAYDQMLGIRQRINYWEERRVERIKEMQSQMQSQMQGSM